MLLLNRTRAAGPGPVPRLALAIVVVALAACSGPDDRKRAHMTRGDEHSAAGEYDKARIEFRNVLKIDPHDVEARVRLARILERLGDFRAAASHYQRIMLDHPDHAESRVRMGVIHLLARQPEKALELADEALKAAPDLASAYALRGNAHLALGNPEAAEADARAALAAGPSDVDAIRFAAGLAGHQGDYERAVGLVVPALAAHPESGELRVLHAELLARGGRHDEAIATFREHIELAPAPERLGARLRLAVYLDRLGRLDEAEATLREAITRHGEEPAPTLALAHFLATRKGDLATAERLLLAAAAEHAAPAPFQKALAALYRQTGQTEKVEAILRRTIDEHGTTAPGLEARTALAEIRAGENRVDDARALLDEVLAENNLDKAALTLSAKLALIGGDTSRAISDLRTVLRDDPSAVEATWLLGVAYQRSNELDAAEKQYRRALEISPSGLSPRLDLVQLLAARGDLAQANALISEALGRNPTSLPLLSMSARLQAQARDWAALASTAEALARAHPENALGHYFRGLAAQAREDYGAAARAYERAAELAPDNANALGAMVQSLLAEGRADTALASVEAAVARTPDNPSVLRLQGRLLRGLGRHQDAKAVLRRAVEIDPSAPSSHRELALALHGGGDTGEALAVLEAALPTTGSSLLVLAELGQLYDLLGRHEDAIALYERYLAEHPDSLPAMNNLAMLLATRRIDRASLDRAATLAERFRESRLPAYLDTLGWVYHKRGEAARAIPVLEDVVALSPDVPTFQFHLGAALVGGGDVERGRAHIERSLRSPAPFPEREQAVAMLDELPSR